MSEPTVRLNANRVTSARSKRSKPVDPVQSPVSGMPDGVRGGVLAGDVTTAATVCRIVAHLLVLLLPAWVKRAVMSWSPAVRFDVANVAWLPASSTVLSLVEPSKKVTLPRVGEAGPTTVKVNTTGWPDGVGFREEVNVAPPGVPVVPPPVDTVVGELAAPVVGVDGVVVAVVATVVVGAAPVVEVAPPGVDVEEVEPPGGKQAPLARRGVMPMQANVLVTVAVQVRVPAPIVAERLHWSIVTVGAESDATPAVAVQVTVPVAPELLH